MQAGLSKSFRKPQAIYCMANLLFLNQKYLKHFAIFCLYKKMNGGGGGGGEN